MFENYSPHALRNAIEIELQKTDDAKIAAMIAMKNLKKNPLFYESMMKSKIFKVGNKFFKKEK